MRISSDYPFTSRAACYGDGCFTTAAIESGSVELLDLHILRLQQGCKALQITVAQQHWQHLHRVMAEVANDITKGVLKVIVSAGSGGRGYARSDSPEPEAFVQVIKQQPDYSAWRTSGISIGVSSVRLAKQTNLARLKHLNRLEQTLIKMEKNDYQDSLVLDDDAMIIESSAGNVFWRCHNRWYTPELEFAGVEGVMRNHIMTICKANSLQISQVRAAIDVLKLATDVFICNSLMKLVPVKELNLINAAPLKFKNSAISSLTALLEKQVKL